MLQLETLVLQVERRDETQGAALRRWPGGLVVVTRNTSVFEPAGVGLLDPWQTWERGGKMRQ